ncbi:unnamed protein product, partial [Heterotrigona itama]
MVKSGRTLQGIEGVEDGKIIENFRTVKPVGWVGRQRCLGWATPEHRAQGVYGSIVGRYRQSRRRKDVAGRSQDQPRKGQPAEPGGNDEEEKREATRRNGYEEIPPP